MSGEDASLPKGVEVPSEEPLGRLDTQKVRGQIGGESVVSNGGAGGCHGRVAEDEPHGVEVGPFEAFFGDDGFDLAFGGELGGVFGERVVG